MQMLSVSVEVMLKFVALFSRSYMIWHSAEFEIVTPLLHKFKGNRGTELKKL